MLFVAEFEGRARMDIQINLWSLLGLRPGICPLGSCQRDICQRDICRPARRRGPAEAVGGRRQLLFLRRPEKRHRGSRISTSKAPNMRLVGWKSPEEIKIT